MRYYVLYTENTYIVGLYTPDRRVVGIIIDCYANACDPFRMCFKYRSYRNLDKTKIYIFKAGFASLDSVPLVVRGRDRGEYL